jgi:enamine deaminase RidA (YjgF/YER057c/UK114 family)
MVERSYVVGTWQKERSFSPAVITKGGSRTVWLAGHAASMDKDGKPFKGDFAAQVRRTFEYMRETMTEAGGTLDDIVTMTVFIIDSRYGKEFVDIRKEFFKEGKFPGSMLITCSGFAHPGMMIEIQGIALLD